MLLSSVLKEVRSRTRGQRICSGAHKFTPASKHCCRIFLAWIVERSVRQTVPKVAAQIKKLQNSSANLCDVYLVAKCYPLQAKAKLSLLTEHQPDTGKQVLWALPLQRTAR